MKTKQFIAQVKNNKEVLGRRITDLRKLWKNMPIEKLSVLANIALDTLKKIEAGLHMPGCDKIKRIAKVFNVTTDFLMQDMTFIYVK